MDYILIVDDDTNIARSTAHLLREVLDEPLDVAEAHSFEAAMDALRRPGLQALLTDHHLGRGPTGTDLLKNAGHIHPDATLVLMTADIRPDVRQNAVQAGADAFLEKPFRPPELLSAVLQPSARKADQGVAQAGRVDHA